MKSVFAKKAARPDPELLCELKHARIAKGKTHRLEMAVTDACGNRTTEFYDFTW